MNWENWNIPLIYFPNLTAKHLQKSPDRAMIRNWNRTPNVPCYFLDFTLDMMCITKYSCSFISVTISVTKDSYIHVAYMFILTSSNLFVYLLNRVVTFIGNYISNSVGFRDSEKVRARSSTSNFQCFCVY